MFNIPDMYKVDKKIPLKDLISKDFKPAERKKIKDILKKAVLTYQISGEEIPSISDNIYRYQVIQYYDFEVTDVKKSGYIAKIYQELIKSPCVIRIHDSQNELYSLAMKRLSQTDSADVVVTDSITTSVYPIILPDTQKRQLQKLMDYNNIINRLSKVVYYQEIFVKVYVLMNSTLHKNVITFLDKTVWYDNQKVMKLFMILKELKANNDKLLKTDSNADKMKINQSIRTNIELLESL